MEDSILFQRFKELCEQQHNTHFDFLVNFKNIKGRISDEIGYINLLFPEYTPHDEKYHINQLFTISEIILGEKTIKSLNLAELFILICSLYGHDWGMAVSQKEKEKICSQKKDFPESELLDNESDLFKSFLQEANIARNSIDNFSWQEYVRKTHAQRSAKRIRSYFSSINTGIGEAIARVCEAHWLDIEKLENWRVYPTDFSVLNHSVNLKALGIYLRLIDLYDLSEERTPYVLWKYVSPKNPYSIMEWNKHKAVFSITAPTYSTGRILKIDGSTNDIEVWSKLKDLENWSNEQLRSSLDLLARMNHSYHKIDIFFAQWNIEAKGFNPINIQFDFDKNNVFKIFSDEIYENDNYVFLRELLQNSIDAIKLRIGIMEKEGFVAKDFGRIVVDISIDDNGRQIIKWNDNGIGMDEYIVRNYLTVIGKSYYKSSDFDKLGIKIDPISKFGIGIVSCFKVANQIRIETKQEPYLNAEAKGLLIEIPAIENLFRIKEIDHADIGTTITVYVEPNLINLAKGDRQLRVFEYLKKIAAFSPYPIIVQENEKKSLIRPFQENNFLSKEEEDYSEIYMVTPKHIIDECPELKDIFEKEVINMMQLPDLNKYDGYLVFVKLRDQYYDWYEKDNNGEIHYTLDCNTMEITKLQIHPFYESIIGVFRRKYISYSALSGIITIFRLMQYDEEYVNNIESLLKFSNSITELGVSSAQMPNYSFYCNGILISQMNVPHSFRQVHSEWFAPSIVVNYKESLNTKINIARTKVLNISKSWEEPIYESLFRFIKVNKIEPILKQNNPRLLIIELAKIINMYRIPISMLWQCLDKNKWPILTIVRNKFEIIFYEDINYEIIPFEEIDYYHHIPRVGIDYEHFSSLFKKSIVKSFYKEEPIEYKLSLRSDRYIPKINLDFIIFKTVQKISFFPLSQFPERAGEYKNISYY
jgi:hypothetical protein